MVRVILAALLFIVGAARADPIHLQFALDVTGVSNLDHTPYSPHPGSLFPTPAPGDRYLIDLTIDQFTPLTASIYKGTVLSSYAKIGSTIWDSAHPWFLPDPALVYPDTNQFAGYVGPFGGFGFSYLGFELENGIVTALHGAVYGSGDYPFIDFLGDKFETTAWFAYHHKVGDVDDYSYDAPLIVGRLGVIAVSEPEELALILLALIIWVAVLRLRSLAARNS